MIVVKTNILHIMSLLNKEKIDWEVYTEPFDLPYFKYKKEIVNLLLKNHLDFYVEGIISEFDHKAHPMLMRSQTCGKIGRFIPSYSESLEFDYIDVKFEVLKANKKTYVYETYTFLELQEVMKVKKTHKLIQAFGLTAQQAKSLGLVEKGNFVFVLPKVEVKEPIKPVIKSPVKAIKASSTEIKKPAKPTVDQKPVVNKLKIIKK